MSRMLGFTIAPGAMTALRGANSRSPGYDHVVGNGDLGQLGQQAEFLRDHGFDVGHRDVYPAVTSVEERNRALKMFLDYRVPGWWNMTHEFVAAGACTQEELNEIVAKWRAS